MPLSVLPAVLGVPSVFSSKSLFLMSRAVSELSADSGMLLYISLSATPGSSMYTRTFTVLSLSAL